MRDAEPIAATVAPAPSPALLQELRALGFSEVRYDGLFELLASNESIFLMSFAAWRAAPEAMEDNLHQAAIAWLRRRN